jgi:hypothetical protein
MTISAAPSDETRRGGQVRYNELASLAEARSLTTGCGRDSTIVCALSRRRAGSKTARHTHTPTIGATRDGTARETERKRAVVGGGEEPTGYALWGGGDNAQPPGDAGPVL